MSWRVAIVVFLSVLSTTAAARAQVHQHAQPPATGLVVPVQREGSGTSWLPDATPMFAAHGPTLGGWRTMVHGVAFVQYLRDQQPRGAAQFGSVNWLMADARRAVGAGELALRGMISIEPWTIRGCGYPDLLASGEVCDGHAIVDRQHAHDLIMELAGRYSRALSERVALHLYAGLAGEPALGPVAFPHRPSALPNPIAPISHHWLDATHLAFGVITAGVHGSRWKVESSLFNGREPDDDRVDLDLAALDWSAGRVTFLPTSRWAVQASAGHLSEAEEHGADRVDVGRATGSVIYHRPLANTGLLATTVAWGRNVESGEATQALLAESSLSVADRHVVFARAEVTQKTAHDLDLHGPASTVFTVGKMQVGYSHLFADARGWRLGIGASLSVGIVPAALRTAYGTRTPLGGALFLTVRPRAMS